MANEQNWKICGDVKKITLHIETIGANLSNHLFNFNM